ncbi:MAG: hypothetical protein LBJ21_05585 [Acidobacteriota bacterium]|nr:hypothetical protein [Acidobacteriota bacterium]
MSELLNAALKTGESVSISDMVNEASGRGIILASEGEPADQGDLENGFINIIDALCREGAIKPVPENENEIRLLKLYESGELSAKGYGGKDGDQFLNIKWVAVVDRIPVIVNINL